MALSLTAPLTIRSKCERLRRVHALTGACCSMTLTFSPLWLPTRFKPHPFALECRLDLEMVERQMGSIAVLQLRYLAHIGGFS